MCLCSHTYKHTHTQRPLTWKLAFLFLSAEVTQWNGRGACRGGLTHVKQLLLLDHFYTFPLIKILHSTPVASSGGVILKLVCSDLPESVHIRLWRHADFLERRGRVGESITWLAQIPAAVLGIIISKARYLHHCLMSHWHALLPQSILSGWKVVIRLKYAEAAGPGGHGEASYALQHLRNYYWSSQGWMLWHGGTYSRQVLWGALRFLLQKASTL